MVTTSERPVLHDDGSGNGDFQNSRRLYHGAAAHTPGKKVFDFGCGNGHGSYFLAPWALGVLGFELDPVVAAEANEKFGSPTLRYTDDLDAVKGPFDIVVSIEAIEHLEKDELVDTVEWFSRIAPEIYCTTPNGNVFPYRPQTPQERRGFHVWHYTEHELIHLFRKFYTFVDVHGVLRDPVAESPKGRYMGYAVYASNKIATPPDFMASYWNRAAR